MKKPVQLRLCLDLTPGIVPALGEDALPCAEQPTPLWDDGGQTGSTTGGVNPYLPRLVPDGCSP